jgi:hypothetical protein
MQTVLFSSSCGIKFWVIALLYNGRNEQSCQSKEKTWLEDKKAKTFHGFKTNLFLTSNRKTNKNFSNAFDWKVVSVFTKECSNWYGGLVERNRHNYWMLVIYLWFIHGDSQVMRLSHHLQTMYFPIILVNLNLITLLLTSDLPPLDGT